MNLTFKTVSLKYLTFLTLFAFLAISCNNQNKVTETATQENVQPEIAYQKLGEGVATNEVLTSEQIAEKYKNLKSGDTINIAFKAKVNEVCQAKGCWMKMDLGEEEAMVKFKDYGFFMPLDLAGEEVVVEGKAFVDEMSVDEQQHYAEDAGKSEEEIAAITEPKRTLSFLSSGVLVPEKQ